MIKVITPIETFSRPEAEQKRHAYTARLLANKSQRTNKHKSNGTRSKTRKFRICNSAQKLDVRGWRTTSADRDGRVGRKLIIYFKQMLFRIV